MDIDIFENTVKDILQVQLTPYILCSYNPMLMEDSLEPLTNEDGDLVFNISPKAIRSPKLDRENEEFSFKATFNGVKKIIKLPIAAIRECYAVETL